MRERGGNRRADFPGGGRVAVAVEAAAAWRVRGRWRMEGGRGKGALRGEKLTGRGEVVSV